MSKRSRSPILERVVRGIAHRLGAPVKTEWVWSIGIYQGKSPVELAPTPRVTNPVLSRTDVTDVPAAIIADPFMIHVDGNWYMFFEVLHKIKRKGEIGYAVSSDGIDWKYKQIVLAEPFHLSYPLVFDWKGDYYMIPESRSINEVRLYRATRFPAKWEKVATLLERPYADSTVFRFENRWWLFADASASFRKRHRESEMAYRDDTLRLFYAQDLTGPWHEHPKNPIISYDPHIARPGGRVLAEESLIRFAQDCYPIYGTRIHALQITGLSPTSYEEREIEEGPALGPSGSGWNRSGMHHVDAHPIGNGHWIACVDGYDARTVLA